MRYLVFLVAMFAVGQCAAQTYNYYDGHGNYAGQSRENMFGRQYYDGSGGYVGRSQENMFGTDVYDRGGNHVGTIRRGF